MTVPIAPGLSPSESQLLALLRAGVSRERAVAIGRHRNTWSAADVDAMAALVQPPPPKPKPQRPVVEKQNPTERPECGTSSGYYRHRKNRERQCVECRRWRARYLAGWREGDAS